MTVSESCQPLCISRATKVADMTKSAAAAYHHCMFSVHAITMGVAELACQAELLYCWSNMHNTSTRSLCLHDDTCLLQ